MKRLLLILLGVGIAQASGAAEVFFQPNNTLSQTIANISTSTNYGSGDDIYSTRSGAYMSSNDEISKAIDNLNAHAKQKEYQLKVGLIYYEGKGVRQDLVSARRMFQKAASQGDIRGQGMLGFFYEEGLGGLKRNRATAKELYGKTCDKGHQYGCDQYRRLNERGY